MKIPGRREAGQGGQERRRRAAIALVAMLAVGCSGAREDPAPSPPAERAHEGAGGRRHALGAGEPSAEAHGTPPEEPPARLVRFTGEVARARGTIAAGDALEAGESLIVRGQGSADVDLGEGGRVRLEGDTEIRIGEGGPAQVLLVRGSIHALVPAGPSGPRPPLRIATAAASVDLPGSGEVLIVAHASGVTWVAALSGLTTVATGEVDARRRLRIVELPPARALLVLSRMAEPTEGPSRLEDARAASRVVLESAVPLEADRAARDLAEAAARLDESLLWLETETRHGLELTAQHREAVRAGQSAEGMRLQRELVAHSQQLYSLRQVATARWERVIAQEAQMSRLPQARPSELAAARRDRVSSLLGL